MPKLTVTTHIQPHNWEPSPIPLTAPSPEFSTSADAPPDLQFPPLIWSSKLCKQGSSLSLLLSLWELPLKTKTKQKCISELVVKTSLLTQVKVFLPSLGSPWVSAAAWGAQECWHLQNLPEAGMRAAAKPPSLAGGDTIFMPHRSYLLHNPTLQQTWKHMASVNCMKTFGRKTIFQDKWEIKPNQAMFFPFHSHY